MCNFVFPKNEKGLLIFNFNSYRGRESTLPEFTDFSLDSTESTGELQTKESNEAITSVLLFYFDGFNEFKKIIHDSKTDLLKLIGDTKILMAVKKNPLIGNKNIRNKTLGEEQTPLPIHECKGIGCLQYPLVNTSKHSQHNL